MPLTEAKKAMLRACGFAEQVKLVEAGLCPFCKKPIGKFRDMLSEQEFEISGLCQQCQDETFREID